MQIDLRYVTRFLYSTPVWESHNMLRACPVDGNGQRLTRYEVAITPSAPVFSYVDSWGTRVDTFEVLEPHTELVVEARASVATSEPTLPFDSPITAMSEPGYLESHWRFLQPTRHTLWGESVASVARDAVGGANGVIGAVDAITRLVGAQVEYRPGATAIGIDVDSIWGDAVGVCQDFAHLTIAMLRSVGIAARYVSGYFFASDPSHDSPPEGEIVVATHAWVEVSVPGSGWWAVDPTNNDPVGQRHVKIGHGRDYDDVTPLRGVYYGESEHSLAAEVTMSTRVITRTALPEVEMSREQVLAQQ